MPVDRSNLFLCVQSARALYYHFVTPVSVPLHTATLSALMGVYCKIPLFTEAVKSMYLRAR